MVRLEAYKAEHLDRLIDEDANVYLKRSTNLEQLRALEKTMARTIFSEDGKIVACAGIVEFWHGRGEAWAVLRSDCRRDFLGIHHTVKRFLDDCPIRRIEAAVSIGFLAGHRWVNQLGFKLEAARLRSYSPEGEDMSLYARVR